MGVSLVVSAASSLTRGICLGVDQQLITVLSAAAAFYYQAAWIYPALIVGGGLTWGARLRMRCAVRTAALVGMRGLQSSPECHESNEAEFRQALHAAGRRRSLTESRPTQQPRL